jgi:predicted RNase H-like HicB family nuclease/predicted RNA binding protein YcfA (HicA-like mRNA interferase family)
MIKNSYKISIMTEKEADSYYAYCPELAGCQTQADSLNELGEGIQEAVNLYLESLTEADAVACLSSAKNAKTNDDFSIQLRLTAPQAEKLLLEAGFQMRSKNKHRIYAKDDRRIILPFQEKQILYKKIIKQVLEMVES